uniref:Putative ovule protein n=1 Tax=Solanum chacoense TaxID=4108 RepID=A0A0V0IMZ2_SOLCH
MCHWTISVTGETPWPRDLLDSERGNTIDDVGIATDFISKGSTPRSSYNMLDDKYILILLRNFKCY